jgi:glycosyltransferase involved in cell wall biosynthesis
VIIPTYNNEKTLRTVLDGVLQFSGNIIIVNDGSTDSTAEILKSYPQVLQIQWQKNQGKGKALWAGFKKALALGFDYAITIDSDGQHFAQDIPIFIKTLEEEPTKNLLLIGERSMTDATIPKKSSFGNKFSNFWFWFETGIRLRDTQCGFRLYPLAHLKDLTFYTSKFEFEIEVIVRAAWNGTTVKNVPVKVLYDEFERVSHFRPVIDFTRISILNTWFVFLTIFYIKPRDLLRRFKKKGFRRFFYEDFWHNNDSPKKKALSIALGVFIGLSPLWGFHTVIVIFLALLFKLNKVIAFAFSNISLPPFIPFVLYASSKIGQVVTGQDYTYSIDDITEHFEVMKHLKTYIIGSILLSITSALILGLMAFVFLSIFDRKKIAVQNG